MNTASPIQAVNIFDLGWHYRWFWSFAPTSIFRWSISGDKVSTLISTLAEARRTYGIGKWDYTKRLVEFVLLTLVGMLNSDVLDDQWRRWCDLRGIYGSQKKS